MARRVKSKKPARAQVAVVPTGTLGAVHLDQFLVLGLDRDLAAVAAKGASRVRAFEHPGPVFVHREPADDGTDRANLHAAAAEFAVQGMGAEVLNFGHRASSDRGEGLDVHDLVAVADTTQTLHATVHLRFDQGAEIFLLENALGFRKPAGGRGVFMGKILEVALPALIADRAIQRVIGQDEFEHRLVGVVNDRRGSPNSHALGRYGAARSLELRHPFDFDQAHATVRIRLEFRMVAEVRNHHTNPASGFDHQRAFRHRDGNAVDGQADISVDAVAITSLVISIIIGQLRRSR